MSSRFVPTQLLEVLDVMARKVREDESRIGVSFPYVTGLNGEWRTMPASCSAGYSANGWSHGNWFGGFWIGLLVACHIHTGEDDFLELAQERMRLIAQRVEDPNTHDIGFIFWSSAVRLYQLTGEMAFATLALKAASRLRSRLINTDAGAYISAWGPLSDERGRASSAIDTMANIPLLYWAAAQADDGSYRLAGESHAMSTARAFIRDDWTSYHAVAYDLKTGDRIRGYTFQGLADDSAWSRGSAWAVYGYAATAAATGKQHYLDIAIRLADKWLEQLGDADCPPWDFDDRSPQAPKDSSAAAIMAAALLDLGALHPDAEAGADWTRRGTDLLMGLVRTCFARENSPRGILRHGCYSVPHNEGIDSAVIFGDYYFVEAIMRLVHPGRFGEPLSRLKTRYPRPGLGSVA